jgi:hypothetical protein
MRLAGSLHGTSARALRHVTTIDLSDNRLLSLSGLEGLPCLATLICRRNRLQGVLDYRAPRGFGGSRLRHADLRNNAISGAVSLPPPEDGGDVSVAVGVAAHGSLETLLLDGNKLRSLRGLAMLPHLTRLSVASNQLVDTAGLEPLPKVCPPCRHTHLHASAPVSMSLPTHLHASARFHLHAYTPISLSVPPTSTHPRPFPCPHPS